MRPDRGVNSILDVTQDLCALIPFGDSPRISVNMKRAKVTFGFDGDWNRRQGTHPVTRDFSCAAN